MELGRITFGPNVCQSNVFRSQGYIHRDAPEIVTPTRYLIYCWECNVVEIMYPNDRASDAFREAHKAHKDATELIAIKHVPKGAK